MESLMLKTLAGTPQIRMTVTIMNWDLTLCLAVSMPDVGEISTTLKDYVIIPTSQVK